MKFNDIKKAIKVSWLPAVALLACMCNSSCIHRNMYPKQVASMDSISVLLHKADSNLSKVDSVHIQKCVNHIFIVLGDVKRFSKDTVSHTASEILSSFNAVRWQLQTFQGRQGVIRMEIKKSIDQLGHLTHDIKNNLIKQDSVMIFYGFEMKKAGELIESAHHGMNAVNTQLPLYDLILPQADSLDTRVKSNKAI